MANPKNAHLMVRPTIQFSTSVVRAPCLEVLCESCYFSCGFLRGVLHLASARHYEFGPFHLDAGGRLLFRNGKRLALTPKEVELLVALVEAQGNPLAKEELLQKVWADAVVEAGTVASHISLLRKALGEGVGGQQLIETIPKRGYRFVAPVKVIENGMPQPVSQQPVPTRLSALNNRWTKIGAAVAAIIVLLTLGYFPAKRLLTRSARPSGRLKIAVLPFENLTGDPTQEYVSDGLTEEMITRLAGLNQEQVSVIARTSAMTYKGTHKPMDRISRELSVRYVLEGSVRRWGDRARITVQLIDADTQTHVWARNYESDVGNILKLQGDVAQAVAQEIKVTLKPDDHGSRSTPVDPQVYELCLRGRYEWNKRTQVGLGTAISYFRQAATRDPAYTPAYAGLAEAYAVLPYFSDVSADEAAAKARTAAERALQLDETLADAHGVLGFTNVIHLNLGTAEREYKRALELNTNNATVHHWYSFVLWNMNRQAEALEELERARQLDPLSLVITTDEAAMLCAAHQTDRAIGLLQKAMELDPNFADAHRTLALAYSQKRLNSQAISEARRGFELDSNVAEQTTLAYVYAAAGRPEQARKLLAELAHRSGASPVHLSFVYVGLGDNDHALAFLEQAYRERSFMLTNVAMQTMLDRLRPDSRFQDLQRRITNMMQSMDSQKEASKY